MLVWRVGYCAVSLWLVLLLVLWVLGLLVVICLLFCWVWVINDLVWLCLLSLFWLCSCSLAVAYLVVVGIDLRLGFSYLRRSRALYWIGFGLADLRCLLFLWVVYCGLCIGLAVFVLVVWICGLAILVLVGVIWCLLVCLLLFIVCVYCAPNVWFVAWLSV